MDGAAGLAILALAAAIGIGLIFLVAGWTKLRHRPLLAAVVANYRVLPPPLVPIVASLLPYVELAVGVALIAGLGRIPALAAILLLAGFAAAMAVNIRRGRSHIDCGCGLSGLHQMLGWPLVARNLAFAALLVPVLVVPAPTPFAAQLSAAQLAVAAAGGIAFFLCHLLFGAIGALTRSPATAAFRRQAR
ncbi:MauE/DoxX family redox-associated membrane protein [Sphingomonas sanxanigenens]|uniref:Methylamine utilization protein MauE n=1 Tax=Sphingomonas sanxanigenens DSM 19645 = NX02 TaxID=1123269 RepID=W0ACH4_9SPHN|nr:MauE/DoxX family redox-associated membrane protein [Sphingomonas sanxanigenens]AHE54791.1 hypothetical protein NX02_15550 [Sphingomonas sanxanigenens DSM 19645 = NX02]